MISYKKIIILILTATTFVANARDINIKTNPVGLLLGSNNLEAQYALAENWTLGVGGTYWEAELLDVDFVATEGHVRFDYWWEKAFDQGYYVGGQISQLNMDLTSEIDNEKYSGSLSSLGFLGQLGHHWQWDHFNIDLGGFLGIYDFGDEVELENDNGDTQQEDVPAFGTWGVELFIGWAF